MDSPFAWSFVMFGVILLVLVLVRWKWRRIEVKPGDLAVAALPVVVLLMAQGKIKSFQFGDLKVEAAIREATSTDAAKLTVAIATGESTVAANEFAESLNKGNKARLEQLPGFIPAAAAVQNRADKSAVLAKMESQNVDVLPVIDDQGRFAGVVNRSRLVASVLVDIAARIK
jgi:hypothetical protein